MKSVPQVMKDVTEAQAEYTRDPADVANQRELLSSMRAADSTMSAIPSLYENVGMADKAVEFRNQIASNESYPATIRARALVALASKQDTCAKQITDTPATKKTVKGPDGKDVFQFTKPENPEELVKLKGCVEEGRALIGRAMALETDQARNVGKIDPKTASDETLALSVEFAKPFESARSYNASLANQASRFAEMEGRTADRDSLKQEADRASAAFKELQNSVRAIEAEIENRAAIKKAEEENANANKK